MSRIIYCFVCCFTILISSFGCQQDKLADYDDLVKRSDDITESYNRKDIKVFAETTENKYEIIRNINNWDKEYLSILNIYENVNEKIVKKIIESESEDYNCIGTFYYDKKGDLKVLIIEVSYFNSVCVKGLLNKTVQLYFDNKEIVSKKVSYIDENNQLLANTEKCVDNYDCTFKKHYRFKDIPIENVKRTN